MLALQRSCPTAQPQGNRLRASNRTGVNAALRLPLHFDAAGLAGDAERLAHEDWQAHFNTGVYTGRWSGAAFRSTGGQNILFAHPNFPEYAETPLLAACPHVSAALAMLHCELEAVRFLRVAPGTAIAEHRDFDLSFEQGTARLHIAVVTDPDVVFCVNGERIVMAPGECWYIDASRPHSVEHRGTRDRIHLVADCVVNGWLTALIEESAAE